MAPPKLAAYLVVRDIAGIGNAQGRDGVKNKG